jgi:hypothetical protein
MSSTYSSKVYRGPEGRKLNAKDVAERLLPDLNMNEFLCWSPDLFAYTSYLMSLTGAYQLVVSPPKGETWRPTNEKLLDWIGIVKTKDGFTEDATNTLKINVENWLRSFVRISCDEETYKFLEPEEKEKWGLNSNLILYMDDHISFSEFKSSKSSLIIEKQKSHETYKDEVRKLTDKFDEIIRNIAKKIAEGVVSDFHCRTDNDGNEAEDKDAIYLLLKHLDFKPKTRIHKIEGEDSVYLGELMQNNRAVNWIQFVQGLGDAWKKKLGKIKPEEFYVINDAELDDKGNPCIVEREYVQWKNQDYKERYSGIDGHKQREEDLLGILLKFTPSLLIACWAFFYNEVNEKLENGYELPISKLLCNRDDIQNDKKECEKYWKISQALITMHAIADICCTTWGIRSVEETTDENGIIKKENQAKWFAERLLFKKGSLSTINPGRGRILPKRHNPGVGITLRSISSNLGFHRSSVEVVWRKTKGTVLEEKIKDKGDTFSFLLFPYPLDISATEFRRDDEAEKHVNFDTDHYGFFGYHPNEKELENKKIIDLIKRAKDELNQDEKRVVDAIIFPETALSKYQYESLELSMEKYLKEECPSLFISGVRESRGNIYLNRDNKKDYIEKKETLKRLKLENNEVEDLEQEIKLIEKDAEEKAKKEMNFARNAVYCKYYDKDVSEDGLRGYSGKTKAEKAPWGDQTSKFKQYKHHRWRLNSSQIIRYGLSQTLNEKKTWWEAIKIPRRRVSFLNVGDKITISTLVCEDLARQDPIADLIRHVGPSLVVTLLMDGPQVKSRWSGRYASILSDDPGCSVITLTSLGMVKRDISFGLSRVIGLWSESDGQRVQEIGLAEGAEAVLLILKLDEAKEKTADGREEREATTVLRLMDMIQIYPPKKEDKNLGDAD